LDSRKLLIVSGGLAEGMLLISSAKIVVVAVSTSQFLSRITARSRIGSVINASMTRVFSRMIFSYRLKSQTGMTAISNGLPLVMCLATSVNPASSNDFMVESQYFAKANLSDRNSISIMRWPDSRIHLMTLFMPTYLTGG